VIVLVVPIDLQAPVGRLILPQVQTIRETLDIDATAVVVKGRDLAGTLLLLTRPPDLVVCDSQAVLEVVAALPPSVKCTTFSILFARAKGDLVEAARGTAQIASLRPGASVLIAEACTHHALDGDIGRVKIPGWLRHFVGGEVDVSVASGSSFPKALADFDLIVHCGACTLNRKEMIGRVDVAREAAVPITNYGLCIAFVQGVLRRVLEPFPAALAAYDAALAMREEVAC
jgi:[FeFe] hydrogenase H-cluster maturation GTPase HydF